MHSGEVSRTLDGDDDYSQPPCHLVHLPTAGLALHLEFPEVRDEYGEELDDDGSRDIRHHTQRKD